MMVSTGKPCVHSSPGSTEHAGSRSQLEIPPKKKDSKPQRRQDSIVNLNGIGGWARRQQIVYVRLFVGQH